MSITNYLKLTLDNLNEHSLDSFTRYQEVKQSLRLINDEYLYVENSFTEDWNIEKRRQIAKDTIKAINDGSIAYGAFHNDAIIGFAYLSKDFFGSFNQYVELKMFQVSNEFRNKGIGKKIFSLICDAARDLGCKKLYISAHSSKESQAAYNHLGCVLATEVNQQIAENEPFDIQMEFTL